MKPVTFADPERTTVDILKAVLAGEGCTIGVGVPADWKPTAVPHVQVALDGTFGRTQVSARFTIRVAVRAGSPTEAKRLTLLAEGLLCGWTDGVAYRPLIGFAAARDAQTNAEMASVSLSMTALAVPI